MADQPENPFGDIDRQLLHLLKQRLEQQKQMVGTENARLKESELWQADVKPLVAESEFSSEALYAFMRHVSSLTRRFAGVETSVTYLGPIYSYSYLAAVKHFGVETALVPVATIDAAFEEVARKQSDFAVVPIENSTDGRIVDTLGMFARTPAKICGEVLLPIHHCLMANCSRGQIRQVLSKPQAISQCRNWLAEHLPDASLEEVASTTHAAREAAQRDGVAAIASAEAGLHHGLQIVDRNIEDNLQNRTRFAVIGNLQQPATGRDKTSLMFQLEHKPGALASAMVLFQNAQVNLTWIESFPLPSKPNEYLFFVELEGHISSKHVSEPIQALQSQCPRLDILGSYPRGEVSA